MQLNRARFYTKLDIPNVYNVLRIAPSEVFKIVFLASEGLYETLVIPFGLTNAQASLENFINNMLALFLDRVVTVYLNNILIYPDKLTQHLFNVHIVL